MLGIFLIICLAVFWFIQLKAYNLLKADQVEPVEIDSDGRTYNVCHHASVLNGISLLIVLIGYLGCRWPYLFIEGVGGTDHIIGIVGVGLIPVLVIAYACYLNNKNANGYIRISTDEIEYKRHKSFTVKVSDIKKITYLGMYSYRIHLKEKSEKPLIINLSGFYKKKEICSLMKQLRAFSAKMSGRDKSLTYKLSSWKLVMILGKYYSAFCAIVLSLLLFYTSYCCIDYDFFKKDYVAQFNALGADPNKPENAWSHYVQAVVNYKKLGKNFQEIIDSLRSGQMNLTDDQEDDLRKWFNENTSSWASLKKAASVNYCNAAYENISIMDSMNREDFSSPFGAGRAKIRHLYINANAGRLAGILDLGWFELFQMQLVSSKHFVEGSL